MDLFTIFEYYAIIQSKPHVLFGRSPIRASFSGGHRHRMLSSFFRAFVFVWPVRQTARPIFESRSRCSVIHHRRCGASRRVCESLRELLAVPIRRVGVRVCVRFSSVCGRVARKRARESVRAKNGKTDGDWFESRPADYSEVIFRENLRGWIFLVQDARGCFCFSFAKVKRKKSTVSR